jgi:hypothetical protein
VRFAGGTGGRGIHLQLRMHVLPRLHKRDERNLSELRRRISATAEETRRGANRVVGEALRLPGSTRQVRQATRLPYTSFSAALDPIGQKAFLTHHPHIGELASNAPRQKFATQTG